MNTNDIEFGGRLKVIGIIIILIITVLIGRMGYLQIYKGEYYSHLADGNRIRIVPAVAPRGNFYDRNGVLLVTNRPGFAVSLLPLTEPISDDVINRLSLLLKVSRDDIKKKIDSHVGFDPIRIKTGIGPEIYSIIAEQKDLYPGVVIEVLPIREYVFKEQAVHVFGYVSEINDEELEAKKDSAHKYKMGDIIGKAGLERVYDVELRGKDGGEQVEVDVTGKPVDVLGKKYPVPGCDLVLTLDKDIQAAAEKAVDEQLVAVGAKAAAVVVMNPQTGEVLAMVSRPSFDPNLFVGGISSKNWNVINNNPNHPMDNKAITGEYPPGSTFKIVTGTAALAEHVVTPEEKIYDSGKHWIVDKGNADGEALGYINFEEAMAHSDNVYFYEMGNRLGIDRLEKYSRMFGLGKPTGINLLFEAEGIVASQSYKRKVFDDDWYLAETFDAAIGQGFNSVTPIQAAMVMGQIAADGQRFKPYLVNKIIDQDGKVVKQFKPEKVGELDVPLEYIRLVQKGLKGVTKFGTAASAFYNYPVDIAGKTGTAENPHGRDHGWFVAYGPFNNPNIVVAVIVEQGGYGSASAVPIGRKILDAAFHLTDPSKDKKAPSVKNQVNGQQDNKSDKNNSKEKSPAQPAVVNNAPVPGKENDTDGLKR
ncbi:MAG: penicillin-binding protein 2 [Anaerovibrio sp.]|uniref:penicillin-binding protein 2 n=1 Tax=Anaerovibrio sp. TaxID=1872532 RepID=UPI0025F809BB|nr:penicillin-binding protein 2 [Anaerovibrio sp.]MCR5175268.1 penicillin-binding protein 2 [Anaerovibrio sp.]